MVGYCTISRAVLRQITNASRNNLLQQTSELLDLRSSVRPTWNRILPKIFLAVLGHITRMVKPWHGRIGGDAPVADEKDPAGLRGMTLPNKRIAYAYARDALVASEDGGDILECLCINVGVW